MVLTTDASQSTWGVTFENQSTNGEWSMEGKKQHINWLELQTVLLGLQSFLSSSCGGNAIKVFCDNSTAVAYVSNMGGKIVSLNCIAYSIWELCLSFDCSIETFHVPGVENVCADRLSSKHESSLEWNSILQSLLNKRFLIFSFRVMLRNRSGLSLLPGLIQFLQKRNLVFLKMKSYKESLTTGHLV